MYVITGVTGNTGSVVAGTLLDRKEKVRVVVRDEAKGARWAARGAEVALASFTDAAALARAFAGAKGAYLMLPPAPTSPDFLGEAARMADALVAAAKGLPHAVLLSSIGAHIPDGTGPIRSLHALEGKLRAAEIPTTAVRAGNFYENSLAILGAAKGAGLFPTFYRADLVVPSVAARDIGRTAAEALLAGPHGAFDVIELSGPRDVTPADMAAALGKVLGRDVAVQVGPEDSIAATMIAHGMSSNMADLYREMFHGLNAGTLRFEGRRQVRGELTMEEWFRSAVG